MKTKKLKTNRNNVETFLPIFSGFYGSIWEDENFEGEAERFGLNDNFQFWEYVNYGEYREALAKRFCSIVEKELSDFVECIQYVGIDSPQYYNFTNDKIACIIRPKKEAVRKYIYEHKAEFETYLVDHFKSRDGFISFHPYTFDDWKEITKDFKDFSTDKGYIQLGSILNFICEVEKIDGENDVLYYGSDDISQNMFYTDSFYEIVHSLPKVKEFVKANYQHEDVRKLAMQRFIEDGEISKYFTPEKINEAINEAINEIEDQTIKLIF